MKLDKVPKLREKSFVEKARDWASFVMSVLAIGISISAAYYTTLRRVDEVRVIVRSAPTFTFRPDEHMEVSGELALTFINSGTRPIAITDVYVSFGSIHHPEKLGLCNGIRFATTLDPPVVESKKIASTSMGLRTDEFGGAKLERPGVYSFKNPTLEREGATRICMTVIFATPSRSNMYKDVLLRSESIPKFRDGEEMWVDRRPTLLFREVGTIFSDD